MESMKKKNSTSSINTHVNGITCESTLIGTNLYMESSLFNDTKIFVSDKIDASFDFDSFLKTKSKSLDIPFETSEENNIDISIENEIFFAEV